MSRIKEEFLSTGKPLLIAEVAQSHDGSLGQAHAFIDAVATTGAHAIKFQTHIAEAESTLAEPWRVKFSRQDDTRFAYWKRMEFTPEGWAGLKAHADEKGLIFLSSPFSFEAADLLESIGIEAWKVASGELSNTPLMHRLLSSKLPMILSSGMSDMEELDSLTAMVKEAGLPLAILQCTTAYPTPAEKVGLNVMTMFAERYRCPVGLSDHSGTIYPGLAGAALGMSILEVHVTLSRHMFGPDVVASVTLPELTQLAEGLDFIHRMRTSPVEKNKAAEATVPMRKLFTKSIVAKTDLQAGTVLAEGHIAYKKPGNGIPAKEYQTVLGKRLSRSYTKDEPIAAADLA